MVHGIAAVRRGFLRAGVGSLKLKTVVGGLQSFSSSTRDCKVCQRCGKPGDMAVNYKLSKRYYSCGKPGHYSGERTMGAKNTTPQIGASDASITADATRISPGKAEDEKLGEGKVKVETKKKTMAELDEELREKLEGRAGDGGEAGRELEGGKAVAMGRGVRENMFRVI